MIPVYIFNVSGSQASAIRVGGDYKDILDRYPDFTLDFTVYGWNIDDLPIFPSYIKPLIIIDKDSFPYTTKLIDVVYSIFPSPDNSQKVAVYRRPVRNTVPVYFYNTQDGVKASLAELPLEPAMDLARVFMPQKEYTNFANIDNTCMPVDGDFVDSMNFDKCIETTSTRKPNIESTAVATTTEKDCSLTWVIIVSSMFIILIALMIWKIISHTV
jgi:hypothetical protein